MTGREYLMSLTDIELAKVIKHGGENIEDLCQRDYEKCKQYKNCYDCITTWLKSERGGLCPKYKVGDIVYAIGFITEIDGYLPIPCKIVKVNINKYSISYKTIKNSGWFGFRCGLTNKESDLFLTEKECMDSIIERKWTLLPQFTEENIKIAKQKIVETAQNPFAYHWVKNCAKTIEQGEEISKHAILIALCGDLINKRRISNADNR